MTTIPLNLLFILLQLLFLEKPAAGASCNLNLKVSVIKTPKDFGRNVEIIPNFRIRHVPTGTYIFNEDKVKKMKFKKEQGKECTDRVLNGLDNTGYEQIIWDIKDHGFDNCGGDFVVESKGVEDSVIRKADRTVWDITEKFKCDGQEVMKRDCKKGGGEVRLTCTNEYHINVLIQKFSQTLQIAMKSGNYNNLYKDYQELLQKLRRAPYMNYDTEIASCEKENDWTKFESCTVLFFQPIIAVVASYRTSSIANQNQIEEWIKPEFTSNRPEWSNTGKRVKEMVNLMTEAFSKDQLEGLFTREMIYTMLHRSTNNSDDFPWNISPLSRYTVQWYEYAKGGKDEEVQKIFSLDVNERIREFCKNEQARSLLCSFMAAKNKYDRSLLYLPQNRGTTVPISADYAHDGLYASFKNDLEDYLDKADIIEAVNKLGEKLGGYFGTLARFDNEIAKADIEYIISNIKKNEEQFTTNYKNMETIMQDITKDQKKCKTLDIFESTAKIALTITATIATAGAAGPIALNSIKDVGKLTKQVATAVKDAGDAAKLVKGIQNDREFQSKAAVFNDTNNNIKSKLDQNKEAIDDMNRVKEAVLNSGSFNSTEVHVKRFLASYKTYIYMPVVTAEDLSKVNMSYTEMLDTFATTIEGAGVGCNFFVGKDKMKQKINQAKATWTSINSLLKVMQDQQSRMIDALVKVVRSKLDEMAAKRLEPDLSYYSYNFEILVRLQLAVRVAAQQYCDTYQFMNNDALTKLCIGIGNTVFLDGTIRKKIEAEDINLQDTLKNLKNSDEHIKVLYPLIPVTSSTDPNIHAINWDKLMDGEIVEFELPVDDSNFVKYYQWTKTPNKDGLLKSFEIFIPNNILENENNNADTITFNIAAIQENVVINLNKNAQRYTVKSEEPLSTDATYSINERICGGKTLDKLYVEDGTQYCLQGDSGRFISNLELSPPVSMYSKFRIQLTAGYEDQRQILKELRPVGDTLQLRAHIKVYTNPGGGKTRTILPSKASPPVIKPCEADKYLKMAGNKPQCESCPPGSVPVAHGTYCASETAFKEAKMG